MKALHLAGLALVSSLTLVGCGGGSDIAAGGAHTIAYSDGQLYAWGRNNDNQVGNGSSEKKIFTPAAIELPLPEGVKVVEIKANLNFTLLLDSAGDVWAWGRNKEGSLGTGTLNEITKPTKIAVLDDEIIVDIGAGQRHGLAVTLNGDVWAWGNNAKGQLGVAPNPEAPPRKDNISTPQKIAGLNAIKNAEGGGSFSLLLDYNGKVYAFGDNDNGQLGIDPKTAKFNAKPSMVKGISQKVKGISAGKDHAIALLEDGSMLSWGLNRSGQLGNGTNANSYPPSVVNTSTKMKQISSSGNFNLAISEAQTLYSWGQNLLGSLGTGRKGNESIPVLVDAFSQPVLNAVNGLGHSIVITQEKDGSEAFWTFGLNSFGQIGIKDAPFKNFTPKKVVFPELPQQISIIIDNTLL